MYNCHIISYKKVILVIPWWTPSALGREGVIRFPAAQETSSVTMTTETSSVTHTITSTHSERKL